MAESSSRLRTPLRRDSVGMGIWIALAAVLFFFVVSAYISFLNTRTLYTNAGRVAHTHDVILGLSNVMSMLRDAETGQRGYLLTGEAQYLEPYNMAIGKIENELQQVERLISNDPSQVHRLATLRPQVSAKLNELAETVEVQRTRGREAAMNIVRSDRGKAAMDAARSIVGSMQAEERDLRAVRLEETKQATRRATISLMLSAALGMALSIAIALLLQRSALTRQRQEWLQVGQVGLNESIAGEQEMLKLGDNVLGYLARYFDAYAGALYVQDGGEYRRVATYGVPSTGNIPLRFHSGDGLLGQAVRDKRVIKVSDVPDGYLQFGSALGQANPRHLLIAPLKADEKVNAVIELGFVQAIDPLAMTLLERIAESVGLAVRSSAYRSELQNLLEETQRQSEELQAQSEELKVNNEELEEQSNALKASQVRLEQQQAELEQTNAQLEEQTQQLEMQRDDITRAKTEVQQKAEELERASQYKSDFLANMSHELRTPLNSSLILAKLLADNLDGNLTDEQVRYAETIQSSGNDLLALINDILDLSKIEAGHMEVRAESLPLKQLISDMNRLFEPLAKQRGLQFAVETTNNCPNILHTDRQRLEQILKNLLSNAFKFTEKGSVSIKIACSGGDQIAFTVRDTGIGINLDQQKTVFDAFRQADGSISRKYGGTGLGLSISRELAKLLGGYIELTSEPGKGSNFTLTIPVTYDEHKALARPKLGDEPASTPAPAKRSKKTAKAEEAAPPAPPAPRIDDDRETLAGDQRVILVVEDDESFARILYDLAHELGFQCLIATTAEDALTIARQYLPSAVVLDVNLPDHSGLSVLDRLKHDARTRHIPVHVVSGEDYTQTALSLGAVGYMIKPVKRAELADALKKMEMKLAQRMRRVLIVEDDEVQRDSVRKLLGTRDVQTVAVGTAQDCLVKLKEETFDCMVLDLSLPDTSGYALLETLSKEETYAFPPVIVYTGRDLSADEEQQLRRYSKSIIIKGAKSPERLLDEVTLFLHQVVSELPPKQRKMIEKARNRDAVLEGRRILIVEDDVRNVYALSSILEPHGTKVKIARNGKEALEILEKAQNDPQGSIDLVLMDVMMPEMDGLTATRMIRKNKAWKKLPVIMLTAKAMRDDQERCLDAGANDYMAKPLDVEKLLSLVRVWMPR